MVRPHPRPRGTVVIGHLDDVGLLSADEGENLIASAGKRGAVLRAESHPTPSYLYDLVHTWENELPRDMVVHASGRNLARIDETFAAPVPRMNNG